MEPDESPWGDTTGKVERKKRVGDKPLTAKGRAGGHGIERTSRQEKPRKDAFEESISSSLQWKKKYHFNCHPGRVIKVK